MSKRARRRSGARYLAAVAALAGSALIPITASATLSATDPVDTGENITVFHNIDFVAIFGVGAIGDDITVDVIRDGVTIGGAAGPLVDAEGQPGLEVNHGVDTPPPADGDCWTGFTPDILPGDRIVVTNTSQANEVDEVIVDDITFSGPAEEAANGDILVHGEARRANGDPIPVEFLDSAEFRDTSQFRGVPDEVIRTPGTTDGFTMVYHPPYELDRNTAGLNQEQRKQSLLTSGGHAIGFGHVDPLPLESMLVDGIDDVPGPALGCEASVSEANSVLSASDEAINLGSGDIDISGSKMTDADGVDVTLTDGTTTVGPLAANVTGNSWTLNVTRAQLETLADGEITVAGSYDHGGSPVSGRELTIQKDTVAPDVSPSLAPGTYTGTRSVALSAGGASILFGTNGVANRAYEGPIALPVGTTTITAKATDAAGNESAQESYTYTINAPANGGGGGGGAGAGGGAIGGGAGGPVIAPDVARFVQVSGLRTRSRVRLRSARRSGIRVSFVAPEGADVVRVQLFRGSRAAQGDQAVGERTVQLRRTGRHAVRINARSVRRALRRGVYRIVISAGQSEDSLNLAVGKRIRIVR